MPRHKMLFYFDYFINCEDDELKLVYLNLFTRQKKLYKQSISGDKFKQLQFELDCARCVIKLQDELIKTLEKKNENS